MRCLNCTQPLDPVERVTFQAEFGRELRFCRACQDGVFPDHATMWFACRDHPSHTFALSLAERREAAGAARFLPRRCPRCRSSRSRQKAAARA